MTDKLKEKAQQALGALEAAGYGNSYAAIELREALSEQAEQEPVAWKDMAFARLGVVRDKMQPEDVAVVQRFLDGDYAANVRTKDLTDDEIATVYEQDEHHHGEFNYRFDPVSFARAVIAADREKNK